MQQHHKRRTIRLLLASTALAQFAFSAIACEDNQAGSNDEDSVLEPITLACNRLMNDNGDPSRTTAEELGKVNTITVEQLLNTEPHFIASNGAYANNPGEGIASVNLRNLGANRSLTLVDGLRWPSADASGIVDYNSIPSAIISDLWVRTSDTVAVGGPGAISGVIDIFTNVQQEGIQLSSSYQISEQGDGEIVSTNLSGRTSFAQNRAFASFKLGYTKRDKIFARDREFSSQALIDNGGSSFGIGGSSAVPGTRIFDSFDFTSIGYTPSASGCLAPAGSVSSGLSSSCRGSATFLTDGTPVPWVGAGQSNTTAYNFAAPNYLQIPLQRYHALGSLEYSFSDGIDLSLSLIHVGSEVKQELAPSAFSSSVLLPGNAAGLTGDIAALLATSSSFNDVDNDGIFDTEDSLFMFIGRRMTEVGPRRSDTDSETTRLSGTVMGQLGSNWDWEASAALARVNTDIVYRGSISDSATISAIESGQCNIFGEGNFSADCVSDIVRNAKAKNKLETQQAIARIYGDTGFSLPSSSKEIALEFGVEYRREEVSQTNDGVLGFDVSGFLAPNIIAAEQGVSEIFGSFHVPIMDGRAGVDDLFLDTTFRHSDYDIVGGVDTWSASLLWAVNDQVALRAGLSRNARVPSFSELYTTSSSGFPSISDPCSSGGGSFVEANRANCIANGVPAAVVGTAFQTGAQIETIFGGNPNLEPEFSDTLTIGVDFTPDFISQFSASLNYFDIEVSDYISTAGSAQQILDGCYSESIANLCAAIDRNTSGTLNQISATLLNLSDVKVEGFDIVTKKAWSIDGVGDVSLSFEGTKYLSSRQAAAIQALQADCVGYFQAQFGICGEPFPEWKSVTTLNWGKDKSSAMLKWRYISGVKADDYISQTAPNLLADKISAQNYLDISGRYDVTDSLSVRLGVLNLTDNQPPVLGACCSEQANTWPATYDPIGRQFFISVSASQ